MFREAGIPVLYYSQFLSSAEKQEIDSVVDGLEHAMLSRFVWGGVSVGEHARAGALRYYGSGTLENEIRGDAILRRYLKASMQSALVMENLLSKQKFDRVVFHHGIYVPQGAIGDVCRRFQVPVINWNLAYREKSVLFNHGDTYHRSMIAEPSEIWKSLPFSESDEQEVLSYIKSRRSGSNDWISFQSERSAYEDALEGLNIDPEKPLYGLLTNVMWDAQLHFKANAFSSMLEWLYATVEHFAMHPELQLIIRIHPAEVLGTVPSRQKIADILTNRYGELPPNIFVVPPEDPRNTYLLMEHCRAAFVYGTKMAIELPCLGLPTVVAGEAWARNKGYTIDVSSSESYAAVLNALPDVPKLSLGQIQLARHYAHYLFFRRMIPLDFAEKRYRLTPVAYHIDSLQELLPGSDLGLDCICDGIIYLTPFIFRSDVE